MVFGNVDDRTSVMILPARPVGDPEAGVRRVITSIRNTLTDICSEAPRRSSRSSRVSVCNGTSRARQKGTLR